MHASIECNGILDVSLQQHLRWLVVPVLPPCCLQSDHNKAWLTLYVISHPLASPPTQHIQKIYCWESPHIGRICEWPPLSHLLMPDVRRTEGGACVKTAIKTVNVKNVPPWIITALDTWKGKARGSSWLQSAILPLEATKWYTLYL